MALLRPLLLLLKAHNKGYTKKDGTFVAPFDDKRHAAAPKPPAAPPPSPAPSPDPTPAPKVKGAKWSALGSMPWKKPAPPAPAKQGKLFGGFMSSQHQKDLDEGLDEPAGPDSWDEGDDGLEPSNMAPWKGHKPAFKPPLPPSAVAHPRRGEKGQTVMIHYPSKPTPPDTWTDPTAIATFTPSCALPDAINGVPLTPWADAPTTDEGWDYVVGQNEELEEPGMDLPKGKVPASGVVVLEPDGRVWLVAPTNRFGGTKNTFPKGGREHGLSLQANAIKEAYEESGLQVEIDSFLGDITRSTSVARYYLARRVGGTPGAMGWESQAVRLVPAGQLREFMDRSDDKKIAEWLEGLV